MNIRTKKLLLLFAALIPLLGLLLSWKKSDPEEPQRTEFVFEKGINISAWLSQTSLTSGPKREAYFTKVNLQELKTLGFDHIRLPVSEGQLYTDKGERFEETFSLVHNVIKWCQELNMRIILDCHMTRDHDFSKYSSIVLFKDPTARDRFVKLWEQLSDEFGKYSNNLLAYELLNEPNAKEPESWNQIALRLVKAIRKKEPERIIIYGSNKANSVTTFPDLAIPKKDPNIILSFHFYYPYLITHYKASFYKALKDIEVPLKYPGQIVSDSVVSSLDEEGQKVMEKHNKIFNKQALSDIMLPALERAKKEGLRIHCGEFGTNFAYRDMDLQLRYMKDLVAIFKENNIPFTVWGYRKQ
ncbi:MAG: glycoside hydrolase family 5 protein, partial [Chryseobacterium sp.]